MSQEAAGEAEESKPAFDFAKLAATLAASAPPATAAAMPRPVLYQQGHKFWGSQPVPQRSEEVDSLKPGPLEVKEVKDIRPDPYKLPPGFEWCDLDWDKDEIVNECYELLRDNYVEDDDAMFRFDYSRDFLRWNLTPPGWFKEWQVGVKNSKTGKVLAMITGTPAVIKCDGEKVTMCEINYLCVHKELRSKRLAPVLIKEVTRRVNLKNIWQAVYTAGVEIPTPIAVAKYWHRSLNPRKLIDIGFTGLHGRQTIQRLNRILHLPEQVATPGWRPLEEKDLPQVSKLLKGHQEQFRLHVEFQEHEFAHIFLPRPQVISSYVVAHKGKITAFGSFYHLYSSIIKSTKHKTLRAAYSFHNVPGGSLNMQDLLYNLLIEANKQDCDVFNCLDLMNNAPALQPLKFGIGDGALHYYLYNYSLGAKCESKDIGVVLV